MSELSPYIYTAQNLQLSVQYSLTIYTGVTGYVRYPIYLSVSIQWGVNIYTDYHSKFTQLIYGCYFEYMNTNGDTWRATWALPNWKPGERWILFVRHFYYVVVSGNVNSGAISCVVKHLAKDRSEPWQNSSSPVGPTPTRQNSGEPQLVLGKIYPTFWD